MERYTIYCTPEQTRKALQLCAPIDKVPISGRENRPCFFTKSPDEEGWNDCDAYYCPTAEQMCGWLEEKHNMRFNIYRYGPKDNNDASIYFREDRRETFYRIKRSYKESLLAAIDEALDYLTSTK